MRQQSIQSKSFSFGPGEWRLSHDPNSTCSLIFDDRMSFILDFDGKVCKKEVNGSNIGGNGKFSILAKLKNKVDRKEAKGSDDFGKFSIFAKLAIMKADGNEYISACKLFYPYSTIFTINLRNYLLCSRKGGGMLHH